MFYTDTHFQHFLKIPFKKSFKSYNIYFQGNLEDSEARYALSKEDSTMDKQKTELNLGRVLIFRRGCMHAMCLAMQYSKTTWLKVESYAETT